MNPECPYFNIWEQTICLQDNLVELSLFLGKKPQKTPENNQLILLYLDHIKMKTEETIALVITPTNNK
jgi:hypothetical protein